VWVMDHSNSISKQNFDKVLDFIGAVIDDSIMGDKAMRTAALWYSCEVHKMFDLNSYHNGATIQQQIHHQKGQISANVDWIHSMTHLGLKEARAMLNDTSHGARASAQKIIILFTDGDSDITEWTEAEADLNEAAGINTFGISIGRQHRHEEERIASDPDSKNILNIVDYVQLEKYLKELITRDCARSEYDYVRAPA
jgi:hypothetical protein